MSGIHIFYQIVTGLYCKDNLCCNHQLQGAKGRDCISSYINERLCISCNATSDQIQLVCFLEFILFKLVEFYTDIIFYYYWNDWNTFKKICFMIKNKNKTKTVLIVSMKVWKLHNIVLQNIPNSRPTWDEKPLPHSFFFKCAALL